MKDKLVKIKELILYIPTLIKFLYAVLKTIFYIRKRLIKEKLLTKKEADLLSVNAFETAFNKNLEKYIDCDLYGEYVYRVNTFDWMRRYGNQSDEINDLCDREVADIEYEISEGELTRKITAAECDVLEYQIKEYKELLEEINTPVSTYTVLH